ncbi:MAG: hypothetical protein HYV63_11735 [Candidatus Schekmanbacteria bacterium]|nr:hypothetical protein [Candidatus Schekmanbacteria bacterium]
MNASDRADPRALLPETADAAAYRYRHPTPPEALRASIARDGVLCPVGVCEDRLVSGFRRVALACELGLAEIGVRRLSGTPLALLCSSVLENLVTGPLDLMEQAALVRAAIGLGVEVDEVAGELLPSARVARAPRLVEQLLAAAELPVRWQRIVLAKGLNAPRCALVARLPAGDGDALAALIETASLSGSECRMVVDDLLEASRRDDRGVGELVAELGLMVIPAGRDVVAAVRAYRRPQLTAHRRRVAAAVAAMTLPPALRLAWDEDLEQRGAELRLRLRSARDLDLAGAVDRVELQKLLDLL